MLTKRHSTYEKKQQRYGYLFILPWFIGLIFMFIRPLAYSIVYSFSDIKLNDSVVMTYAGLKYFIQAFIKDPEFLPRLTTSLSDMAYQVPVILVFSLVIAYVLNGKFKGSSFFKSLFFLPVIIASGVVISVIRGDAYAQIINSSIETSSLFKATSIKEILYNFGLNYNVIDIIYKLVNNIFNLSWKSGIQILIFISAFKSIPASMYEASVIEGATLWESFWKITFPMISPMLLANIVYTIIDTFTDYSNPIISYIASEASKVNISYSSAMSLVYFTITFVILIIVYLLVNKRIFYYVD